MIKILCERLWYIKELIDAVLAFLWYGFNSSVVVDLNILSSFLSITRNI